MTNLPTELLSKQVVQIDDRQSGVSQLLGVATSWRPQPPSPHPPSPLSLSLSQLPKMSEKEELAANGPLPQICRSQAGSRGTDGGPEVAIRLEGAHKAYAEGKKSTPVLTGLDMEVRNNY